MNNLTPKQRIKWLMINLDMEWRKQEPFTNITPDDVDILWDYLVERDEHWDLISEMREGDTETNIPPYTSPHFESKSVAALCPDGVWVGWTYWYEGGKHSKAEEMEWMEDAYLLECKEEEKVVIVREFTRVK